MLQLALETVIDICNILVSELKLGLPTEEGETIEKLKQKKAITSKMAKTLQAMKGMRNILVHRYGEIEDKKIFDNITKRIDDFEKFKQEILKFLKESKE